MSRIGKTPIPVPDKVKVSIKGQAVEVEGPKGKLNWDLPKQIAASQKDNEIVVERSSDVKEVKALHGLARSLVNNMVIGVSAGFSKELEIQGVGFKAAVKGDAIDLNLGYSLRSIMLYLKMLKSPLLRGLRSRLRAPTNRLWAESQPR